MELNKLREPYKAEEVDNHWAISYGDMITLLLGFFVLFFNIKSQVVDLTLVKKDLDEYFSAKAGPVQKNAEAQQDGKVSSPLYSEDVQNSLKIKSNMEGERILVEFPGVSFFRSGNHILTKEGKEALTDFSKAINKHLGSFRLIVRGYTDDAPLRTQKKYKDNLELSAFRSISAIRFLHDQGMTLNSMRIAGYGESSASRAALDRDLASLQRKVVIVIEPLDHTEKKSEATGGGVEADSKTIEEVKNVEIKGRDVSSVDVKEKSFVQVAKGTIVFVKNEAQRIGQTLSVSINNKLNESILMQKMVDEIVILELQGKGFSKAEAKKMLKEYNSKRKR